MNKVNRKDFNWLIKKINNQLVIDHAPYFRGVVYDLGCGQKPYEPYILQFAEKYVGVDYLLLEGTNWADKSVQGIIHANLNEHIPVPDNTADTVVSFSVLEHLSEPQTAIREAYRILKPGGYMVLAVPFQWWLHSEPYDFFRYTRYGLAHLFEKAGFPADQITVKPYGGFWSAWVLKYNYHTFFYWVDRSKGIKRRLKYYAVLPFWWLGQSLASGFDRSNFNPTETPMYVVLAHKPA